MEEGCLLREKEGGYALKRKIGSLIQEKKSWQFCRGKQMGGLGQPYYRGDPPGGKARTNFEGPPEKTCGEFISTGCNEKSGSKTKPVCFRVEWRDSGKN